MVMLFVIDVFGKTDKVGIVTNTDARQDSQALKRLEEAVNEMIEGN